MTDQEIQNLKAHLDEKRQRLSDPFDAAARRHPQVKTYPWGWVATTGAAAAVLAILVGTMTLPPLNPTPSPAWAAILDDLWVAEIPTQEPLEDWNLLDLGADQGI